MKRTILLLLMGMMLGANGSAQDDSTRKKEEIKEENFKYLFSEALKKKIFGDYPRALQYFWECEKIKNDDAVEYEISQLLAMSGDRDKAIWFGKKAIEKDPENKWYYYQLANIYRMFGLEDSMLVLYEELTRKFPELMNDKYQYADLLMKKGDYGKALEIYLEIERKTGKSVELERKISMALLGLGKGKEAMKRIQQAIKWFGQEKELMITYANILAKNGKKSVADRVYEDLVEKYSDDPEVQNNVYTHYMNNGDYEKAIEILKKIVENPVIDPQKKIEMLFQINGKVEGNDTLVQKRLGDVMREMYRMYENDMRTVLLLIDHYTRNGEYAEARTLLRKILIKYPQYETAWRQMLYVCDREGNQDSVIYYAEKAREIFPKNPLYDMYLGFAWLQKKDYEKALAYVKEGIRKVERKGIEHVDKDSGISFKDIMVQLYGLAGELYKEMGDEKSSDEAFEKGLKLDPENDLLLNNYSYYLSLRKKKLKKALKMSGKTIKRNPDNPTFLDTYGWILYQMGKVKEAEKYIRKALENGGDSSTEILMHYGDIMKKLGQVEKAKEYWKKALEKGGNKEEIEKRLKSLRK